MRSSNSRINMSGVQAIAMRKRAEQQKSAAERKADQQKANETQRVKDMEAARGPGFRGSMRSAQEIKAGVEVPGREGLRDIRTGELLSQYKSDPYAGEALQKLKEQAFSEGESPWAKMQMQKQALEESGAKDQAMKSQAQGMAQAQSNLMRQGGLSSGARIRMAQQGAKDLMMAQQRAAGQGVSQRLGIQEQDLSRKQDMLSKFGDAESAASERNIGRQVQDVQGGGEFDMERYKQQMGAYGAAQTAAGQRAAAGAGSKCFYEGVKVLMNDMTEKQISEIKAGDEVFAGGLVLEARSYYSAEGFELYNYNGALLTGSHSVKECGEWTHVENSQRAIKTDKTTNEVYTLVTENHFIISNKVVFSDDVETNANFVSEVDSLRALNLEG